MRRTVVATLLLFALTLLAYLPALRGGFVWRDQATIAQNGDSRTPLRQIWMRGPAKPDANASPEELLNTEQATYSPVASTLFWAEHRFWGDAPAGYRIASLLLHMLSVWLLWRLFVKLGLGSAGLITAAMFAVHPINVEAVAWVAQQGILFATALCLIAGHVWIRWIDLSANASHWKRGGMFALSLALACIALLASPAAFALPIGLMALNVIRRRRATGRVWAGWFALSAAVGLLAGLMVTIGNSPAPIAGLPMPTLWQRLILFPRLVASQVANLLWPMHLNLMPARWALGDMTAEWLSLVGVAAILAILFMLRRKVSNLPFLGVIFFLAGLFAMAGLVEQSRWQLTYVADRQSYFASIGLFAMIAGVLATLMRRGKIPRIAAAVATSIVFGGLTLLCVTRAAIFGDSEALYRNTLKGNPEASLAAANLADLLAARHDPHAAQEAVALYTTAIRQAPWLVSTPRSLAKLLAAEGDAVTAQNVLKESLERHPDDPFANEELADMLVKSIGEIAYPTILPFYERAYVKVPERADLDRSLATIYIAQRRIIEAEAVLQTGVRYNPSDGPMQAQLANILLLEGKYRDAYPHFDVAATLLPNDTEVLCNWGLMLLDAKQPEEASKKFRQALTFFPEIDSRDPAVAKYDPASAKFHMHLGRALREQGMMESAMYEFERAELADNKFAPAFYEAGITLQQMHVEANAEASFRLALSINRQYIDAEVALARLLMTSEDTDGKKLLEAISLLHRAVIDSNETDLSLMVAYADALARTKEPGAYQEADDMIEKAVAYAIAANAPGEMVEQLRAIDAKYQLAMAPPMPSGTTAMSELNRGVDDSMNIWPELPRPSAAELDFGPLDLTHPPARPLDGLRAKPEVMDDKSPAQAGALP